jgi:hypothetical protein
VCAVQVVLVDDRRRVSMREAVLVPEPLHSIFEAQTSWSIFDMAEPLMKWAPGRFGNPSDQHPVGFL